MGNQSSIYSVKAEYPFARLFKSLSPKGFASVFGGEAEQTIAFLLSFSRNKGYVKKVLKILNDEDITNTVSGYLRNVSEKDVDPEFINKIEDFIESSMYRWKHLTFSRRLRKNIFIRGSKLIKSSKIDNFPENLFR
jgi:flagellar motor switch protein FliG